MAEAKFAKACAEANLELDPDAEPDLIVEHEELFERIAVRGWTGLAESYMAGEWRTPTPSDLVRVLAALIGAPYTPRTPSSGNTTRFSAGEIPLELVAQYAGDGMSAFAGHFATGVPTTERVSMKSNTPGAGKGKEPANHFVAVTTFSEPLATEKFDLGDAQLRSVSMVLQSANVRSGSQVLELPSSGGAIAIAAAGRRATVDSVVTDSGVVNGLRERLSLAGVDDSVYLNVVDTPDRALARVGQRYDAIVSVENFETLPLAMRVRYLGLMDELLVPGGRAAVQSIVATEKFTGTADSALESLRAYIWPALRYQTPAEFRRIADKHTTLRVVAQTHAPHHLQLSLQHQRATFRSHLREAAADGFDIVYRRLWMWQLALREALAQLGMIDLVQYTLTHRHRRGVR